MTGKWPISRRTMLRGAAASVSLPLLEVMTPAATRTVADVSGPPRRLVTLFQPNGVYPKAWDPKGIGKDFEFSQILEPLAGLRDDITIVSNLGTSAKGHIAATTAVLTGTPLQVQPEAPALIPKMGIS